MINYKRQVFWLTCFPGTFPFAVLANSGMEYIRKNNLSVDKCRLTATGIAPVLHRIPF
jgi:hypothetical protein